MTFEETYGKDHAVVVDNVYQTHTEFCRQLEEARKERSINISKMSQRADAGPALTSRVKDPNENLTLSTMARFAAAVGKRIEVKLIDPS